MIISGAPSLRALLLATLLTGATAHIIAQSPRKVTQLATGVYVIEHRDAQDGFAGGNTTVIIGERQVLVVDAPFLPSEAREDIAQIRQWTSHPVTFLVTTHFHNDHNFGNRAYMDAFPGLSIIAHPDTKEEMDRFGPGSLSREERGTAGYQRLHDSGKNGDGTPLSDADKAEVKRILARRNEVMLEMKKSPFQSATLTVADNITIDLGGRNVEVRFLGRGNTPGDLVVQLPAERIVAVGDLVVLPLPYFYDGYPREWAATLSRVIALQPAMVVPGHGPVLHDTAHLALIRDLITSAVTQMNEALRNSGPAMFRTVDAVKGSIDLTAFRERFAGGNKEIEAAFDETAAELVRLVFREASLR
ncbi:MAG: MBL fold metallo-hydrolase [Gemmatimonadota bacterium]